MGATSPFAGLLSAARGRGAKPAATAADIAMSQRGEHGAAAQAESQAPRVRASASRRSEDAIADAAEGGHGGLTSEDARDPKADVDGSANDRGALAGDDGSWLDPSARQLAHLAPPGTLGQPPLDAPSLPTLEPIRARSLEELLPALVRKVAWAGDRHKGTVRLELGAGAYAGTTVTVHADGGRVRVELGGHEGPELERLRSRLDARLRRHGLDVESVT